MCSSEALLDFAIIGEDANDRSARTCNCWKAQKGSSGSPVHTVQIGDCTVVQDMRDKSIGRLYAGYREDPH